MKMLFRRSIRSLWRNKKSYTACVMVLSLGIMMYLSMAGVFLQIESGISAYYEEKKLADVFVTLAGMPRSSLESLKEVPGVSQVDGTLKKDVKFIEDGSSRIIRIFMVGAKPESETTLNQYSFTGSPLEQPYDIWVNKGFSDFYGLGQGDLLTININGAPRDFTVRGTVETPEYVFVGSPELTGLVMIQTKTLEDLFSKQGIVTDVSVSLEDGYTYEDVKDALSERLKPFGTKTLVARENIRSCQFISNDINQLSLIGTLLPAIFLATTVIIIYIMLKQAVEQERGQIGTLKAFGFGNIHILPGYLLNGCITGVLSFVFGILMSFPFGNYMYGRYTRLYPLLDPTYHTSFQLYLQSFAIAMGISLISVYLGAHSALKIHPAEAMRAKAPSLASGGVQFKHKIFRILFGNRGIMAFRGIARSPVRSALTALCIMFAFSTINMAVSIRGAVHTMLMEQTQFVETYDIMVSLGKTVPLAPLLNEINQLDGVNSSEGLLTLPVKIINQELDKELVVYGLNQSSGHYKIRDIQNRYYEPPKVGIMLNARIAAELCVKEGDIVELESYLLREDAEVMVQKIFDDQFGPGCYMEIQALSKLFQGPPAANAVTIQSDQMELEDLQTKLAGYGSVESLTSKESRERVRSANFQSLSIMLIVLTVMIFLIAFGAIYNVSRITLAEKARELTTMRILGFTNAEVSAINSFEQNTLLVIATVLGFGPTMLLNRMVGNMMSSTSSTLNVVLSVNSSVVAFLSCLCAVLLSNAMAQREISKFHLVEALKERE